MQRGQESSSSRHGTSAEPRRPPPSSSRSASPSHSARSSRHPRRFVGDGLDYRRPITLPSQASIVDLTAADDIEVSRTIPAPERTASRNRQRPSTRPATRLPRYPNAIFDEVIDLESLPERPTPEVIIDDDATTQEPIEGDQNPSSPEVTFLHARPRANPRPPIPQHRGHLAEHVRRHYQQPNNEETAHGFPMNMLFGGAFPFLRGNGAAVLDEPGGYPAGYHAPVGLPQAFGELLGAARPDPRRLPRRRDNLASLIQEDANCRAAPAMHNAMGFQQLRLRNMMMGGMGPAFHLGNNFVREEAVPAPTYDPVTDARNGFTRSPGEDDVLVCPHCGHELCSGESEEKQQAWVVKACGHVSASLKILSSLFHTNTLVRSTAAIVLNWQRSPKARRRRSLENQVLSINAWLTIVESLFRAQRRCSFCTCSILTSLRRSLHDTRGKEESLLHA